MSGVRAPVMRDATAPECPCGSARNTTSAASSSPDSSPASIDDRAAGADGPDAPRPADDESPDYPAYAEQPPDAEEAPESGFAELGLSPEIVRALTEKGYTTPTPIQAQAIPYVLMGRDLLGKPLEASMGSTVVSRLLAQLLDHVDSIRQQSRSNKDHENRSDNRTRQSDFAKLEQAHRTRSRDEVTLLGSRFITDF